MTDFAFNQTLVRQRGFGALPPPLQAEPAPRPAPRAPAPAFDPRGVGRAPAGFGWDPTSQGPMPAGLQQTDPPPGPPSWWQYAWIYTSANPPAGPPPGVTSAGTVIGTWVETRTNHWVWFAPDNTLTQINGVWVMDNSGAAAAANPWLAFPPPTVSPDGTQGAWSQVHEGYWIWTPGGVAGVAQAASATVASMSTGTVVLLAILGLGALGGIGYLLLD